MLWRYCIGMVLDGLVALFRGQHCEFWSPATATCTAKMSQGNLQCRNLPLSSHPASALKSLIRVTANVISVGYAKAYIITPGMLHMRSAWSCAAASPSPG